MEQNFSNLIENIYYERTIVFLLSLTYPDILKQSKFTVYEISIIKTLALEKLHRQRNLKWYDAMALLENNFLIKQWVKDLAFEK